MGKFRCLLLLAALPSICFSFSSPRLRLRTSGTTPQHAKFSPHRNRHVLGGLCAEHEWRQQLAGLLTGLQIVSSGYGIFSRPSVAFAAEGVATSSAPLSKEAATVEEAGDLLSKFYVDKTFNGQDWDAIRADARKKVANVGSYKTIESMTKSLGDKYTRVVDESAFDKMSKFDLIGAGVLLAPDDEGRMAIASPPMAGSSALAKGLKKGDLVVSINGKSTEGLTSFDVIDLVTKDDNPLLTLGIQKPEDTAAIQQTVSLKRKLLEIRDPVQYQVLNGGPGQRTGVIRLVEFNARCVNAVQAAVLDLESQGVDRYILDLRGNPGGTFQSAAKVAGLFMSDRLAVQVADGSGSKTDFRTSGEVLTDKPLFVWMDRGSASASEVLAGALHDNCRAVLAGDRSFGKGLIQGVFGLNDGTGLIITVARYVTPAGTDIQGTGLQPDISSDLGPSLLGGLVRKDTDMSEADWAIARERQGGKLCEGRAGEASG